MHIHRRGWFPLGVCTFKSAHVSYDTTTFVHLGWELCRTNLHARKKTCTLLRRQIYHFLAVVFLYITVLYICNFLSSYRSSTMSTQLLSLRYLRPKQLLYPREHDRHKRDLNLLIDDVENRFQRHLWFDHYRRWLTLCSFHQPQFSRAQHSFLDFFRPDPIVIPILHHLLVKGCPK